MFIPPAWQREVGKKRKLVRQEESDNESKSGGKRAKTQKTKGETGFPRPSRPMANVRVHGLSADFKALIGQDKQSEKAKGEMNDSREFTFHEYDADDRFTVYDLQACTLLLQWNPVMSRTRTSPRFRRRNLVCLTFCAAPLQFSSCRLSLFSQLWN
jgi:hypothetical protein